MIRRLAFTCIACATIIAAPVARSAQDRPENTAEISGAVTTTGDSPAPLARVLVTISGASLKPSRTMITDDRGRFAFGSLPAGRFTIVASRAPFITTAFGARRAGRPGTPITLAAGQRITDVTIRLTRGAAITGVVRSPGGEPAPGIQVIATSLDGRGAPPAPPFVTDDRGVYRVFGLPPGRYIVSANPAAGGNTGSSQLSDAEMDEILANLRRRSRMGATGGVSTPGASPARAPASRADKYRYAAVYYPGTADLEQAATLSLAEAEERAGVDFDLPLVRVVAIDGRVSLAGATATPSDTQITLTRTGIRAEMSSALGRPATARLDAAGTFRFTNVLPGSYRLLARAMTMTPTGPPGSSTPGTFRMTGVFWAMQDVTVADDDLAGIALTLLPGLTLTSRAVFDARTLRPPDTVQLRLAEVGGAPASVRSGGGRADAPFEISGLLPGTYTISSPLSDAGWWLRSVVVDGRDVLDFPLELGAAGQSSVAVATFSDRRPELSGTLQTAANVPAPEYYAIVFPSDRTFWRPGSRRVQFTRPGTDGQYLFRDLPPGDYLITALPDLEASDLADVSFLDRLIAGAVKVRLEEGEKKIQDLTLK